MFIDGDAMPAVCVCVSHMKPQIEVMPMKITINEQRETTTLKRSFPLSPSPPLHDRVVPGFWNKAHVDQTKLYCTLEQ